jgi:hypothetical protein
MVDIVVGYIIKGWQNYLTQLILYSIERPCHVML